MLTDAVLLSDKPGLGRQWDGGGRRACRQSLQVRRKTVTRCLWNLTLVLWLLMSWFTACIGTAEWGVTKVYLALSLWKAQGFLPPAADAAPCPAPV